MAGSPSSSTAPVASSSSTRTCPAPARPEAVLPTTTRRLARRRSLAAAGHRRVLFLGGRSGMISDRAAVSPGFAPAMAGAGGDARSPSGKATTRSPSAARQAQRFADGDRPGTAIFATADEITIGLVEVLPRPGHRDPRRGVAGRLRRRGAPAPLRPAGDGGAPARAAPRPAGADAARRNRLAAVRNGLAGGTAARRNRRPGLRCAAADALIERTSNRG